MNILEINRFSILFQQPLYIILFFFFFLFFYYYYFVQIHLQEEKERKKKAKKKKPTEIHNGDIGTRLFQGVKDQTIMSNVVAS